MADLVTGFFEGQAHQTLGDITQFVFPPVGGPLICRPMALGSVVASDAKEEIIFEREMGTYKTTVVDAGGLYGNQDWRSIKLADGNRVVISFFGPTHRYHDSVNPMTSTTDPDTSRKTGVWKNLVQIANAPGFVSGACIFEDDDEAKTQYIRVATDVNSNFSNPSEPKFRVYERVFDGVLTNDLYDVVTNPNGWFLLGEAAWPVEGAAELSEWDDARILWKHQSIWLFNGSGTEAQTMFVDYVDGPYRIKWVIDQPRGTATFSEPGHSGNNLERTTYTTHPSCTSGTGGEEQAEVVVQTTITSGSQKVVVDYIDDTEVFAVYTKMRTKVVNIAGAWRDDPPASGESTLTVNESYLDTLTIGPKNTIVVRRQNETEISHTDFVADDFNASITISLSIESVSPSNSQDQVALSRVDLRSGMAAYDLFTTTVSASKSISGTTPIAEPPPSFLPAMLPPNIVKSGTETVTSLPIAIARSADVAI